MVHFEIKYRGQTTKHTLPSQWEEVTVKQFIDLEGSKGTDNPTKLLSILSGIPLPKIMDTKTNLQLQINQALNFITLKAPKWKALALRDRYKFKGKIYYIRKELNFLQKVLRFFLGLFKYQFKHQFYMRPKDIELETFGQKILLQNKLNATDNLLNFIN